jgi:hypothetical protein
VRSSDRARADTKRVFLHIDRFYREEAVALEVRRREDHSSFKNASRWPHPRGTPSHAAEQGHIIYRQSFNSIGSIWRCCSSMKAEIDSEPIHGGIAKPKRGGCRLGNRIGQRKRSRGCSRPSDPWIPRQTQESARLYQANFHRSTLRRCLSQASTENKMEKFLSLTFLLRNWNLTHSEEYAPSLSRFLQAQMVGPIEAR